MKKKLLVIMVVALLFNVTTKASHIIGGEWSIQYVGPGNTYHIHLNHYRDCVVGSAYFQSPIPVGIYDLITNAVVDTFCMILGDTTTLSLGDSCYAPNVCTQLGVYDTTITLPSNPGGNGVYISYARCCRNAAIVNLPATPEEGEVWYAEFPDPAIQNSTPVFVNDLPKGYLCADNLNILDYSCTDADGDSLVYSLAAPLQGLSAYAPMLYSPCAPGGQVSMPYPGPYSEVVWQVPYSDSNMIGDPSMAINPHTGILTVIPPNIGVYVFGVLVKEYDRSSKAYIGEVRKDIQYECAGNCTPCLSNLCSSNFSLAADTTQLHHYIATNNASGTPPISYYWSWGDGAHDTIPYPSHTYVDSGFYTICLAITDSTGCTSTYCDTSFHALRTTNYIVYINVVAPKVTGIKEVNLQTPLIVISPNPATNQLTIHPVGWSSNGVNTSSFHNEAVTVSIMNVLGQNTSPKESGVLRTPPTPLQWRGESASIDVSGLAAGIYFVAVTSEKGRWVGRFVKE